jgi:hypothetical protein
LTAGGHVAKYEFNGAGWTAEDLTALNNLPALASSLTAVSPVGTAGYALYGITAAGELMEFRMGRIGWTARNVTGETRGVPLAPGLVAWADTIGKRKQRVFIIATTQDGTVLEYYSTNGKRWVPMKMSRMPSSPRIVGESLVLLPPSYSKGLPAIFGLDQNGELWRFSGNMRLGWESVSRNAGGPTLSGEISAQYDRANNRYFIFGIDSQGNAVEYQGSVGSWEWSVASTPTPAATGDVVGSSAYRSFYTELVDGAIAEYWLGEEWHVRRLDAQQSNPGMADGSTATSLLTALGVASR